MTQNVRGFAKTHNRPDDWFTGFRGLFQGHQVDAVLLQETRATADWAAPLAASHARAWGYDPAKLDSPLSYWQATSTTAGGVAILLHPQSTLRALRPIFEDSWDAHFMALSGDVSGQTTTLVCIYAPTNKQKRERLFRRLRQLPVPAGLLLVGGDFNCVLDDERDRSRVSATNTDSLELRRLMDKWQLLDTAAADLVQAQSHAEILEFQANSHTFNYRLRDGSKASSRLDRWYVSGAHFGSVASTTTAAPVSQSDHDAVVVTVTPSGQVDRPSRSARRALRYPLPEYAQAAVKDESARRVKFLTEQSPSWSAEESARRWDEWKTELRRLCLIAQRQAARKLTNSLHQRVKRAQAAMRLEQRRRIVFESGTAADHEAQITVGMELLTLDSGDRAAGLRRHLIHLQQAKAARRQRRTRHQYDGHAPSATRAFFRRMSTRFAKPKVVGAQRDATGRRVMTADGLAADWLPIVQQQPTSTEAHDAFFALLPPSTHPPAPEDIVAFTPAEVLEAIKACPRGKASGPDGIPNDWYRSVEDELAQALAPMFSQWARTRVLPSSFTEATVFCLPKVSAPRNGLDYRPIALLNTDYKIFTRLILMRAQTRVAKVVSAAQFGFVAHRQVHDAIDVWDALQAMAEASELPPEATAVLLDFAKAYDTLDRAFLRRAMVYHGFPAYLVDLVDSLHLHTTARFLADGDLSGVVDIHNGIRQGCPLAPVLFILALDLLYKAADADPGLHGLKLGGTTVKLSGYADDTTSYLAHPREECALLRLLERFGDASGLRINVAKSRAIALNKHGPTAAHEPMVIPVAPATELVRHLGMAVASAPNHAAIWARTLQQVRASLFIAHAKTTNLLQRVALCSAVVMPKLAFVGRHAWPTAPIFDRLQKFVHNFAWYGTLTDDVRGRRAWMSTDVAHLPVAQGGIGLPNVRDALMKMSMRTVARWSNAANPVAAAAGHVLLRLRSGGPALRTDGVSRREPTPTRIQPTLAATGATAIRASRATPRDAVELAMLARLPQAHGRGASSTRWWLDGWYHCNYASLAAPLTELRTVQRQRYGEFNLASLLAAHVVGDDVLCLSDGTGVERKDFQLLLRSSDTRVGDIVDIEWVAPRHVKFRCRQHEWPLGRPAVDQFRRFCDVLVHNYPAVLQPHNAHAELQPRPPMHAAWSIRTDDDGSTSLVVEPNPGQFVVLGSVHTKRMAERLARRHEPTLLSFDDHPLLDAHAPLWTSRTPTERPTPRTPARVQRAQRELVARYRRTLAADRVIGTALATVSWRDIAQLPASSSAQRLLLHKIKGLRLSGWYRSAERRGCPHCPDAPRTVDTGHAFHIVWHCPSAQLLWTELRQAWSRLGVDIADTATLCAAVFSLSLPRNPADVWDDMGSTPPPELVPLVDDLMATLWRQQVVACFQRIWQWRNCVADETDPWDLRVARSALLGSFRAAYQQARGSLELAPREHRPFLGSLLGRLQSVQLATEPRAPRSVRTDTDRYLLFFDGGSRGNPGPGGSGAVIIRVHASGGMPRIHWAASLSLASPTTTNNQAEYFGLVVGLRFAAAHKLQPLSVIGDSAMIIRQLKDTRAPKHPRLLVYYGQARMLADKVSVTEWRHHVRAFNKMADWAANLAMDSKRSVQTLLPQTRSVWAGLSTYLAEDVGQWQASTPPGDAGTG